MSAIAHSCASCGSDIPAGARFCASCGARTGSAEGPVTWSISNGIGAGVIAHALLMTIAGRRVPVLVWCVAAAFALFFALA